MSSSIVVGTFYSALLKVAFMMSCICSIRRKYQNSDSRKNKFSLFQYDKNVLYVGENSLNKIIVHSRRVADELE